MRAIVLSLAAVLVAVAACDHDAAPPQTPAPTTSTTQTTSARPASRPSTSNPSYGTSDIDGWSDPSATGSGASAAAPAGMRPAVGARDGGT